MFISIGVETAVQEQKQKSINDLAEMENLVNIARREHAKAVVQLQQLQRHLSRDRDHAVEAVELGKAKLEHELECCRRKLQATQVERNLLMVCCDSMMIILLMGHSHISKIPFSHFGYLYVSCLLLHFPIGPPPFKWNFNLK